MSVAYDHEDSASISSEECCYSYMFVAASIAATVTEFNHCYSYRIQSCVCKPEKAKLKILPV